MSQITYKKLLIQVLVSQTAQILSTDISNQPLASESLRNVVEAISLLKQAEIVVITEQEINEAIVKSQLEGLIQQGTIHE
jgi:hypothetical protein